MKTSVSNIAWGGGFDPHLADRLSGLGIRGVELAPTAIWPDAPDVPSTSVRDEARRWRDAGLEVVSIQSLLYGHPELRLFDVESHRALREHLSAMIDVAAALGAGVAVFGSPRNRQRNERPLHEANDIATEFMLSMVPRLESAQVVLTLEPNAPEYGADFVTGYAEAVALAQRIGSPNVRPQIDFGCAVMVGERPPDLLDLAVPAHVHISAPRLAPPDPAEPDYRAFAQELRHHDYAGWVSLEMLGAPADGTRTTDDSFVWFAESFAGDPA